MYKIYMKKINIRNFVKFANYLADEARIISLDMYKKKIKTISKNKSYFDPVTVADIKIQKKLNKIIKVKFPKHSILGEEESFKNDSEYEWCIDPIDGTKSFIQGVPLWGTLISLSKNNKIILGIADIPYLDERYIGHSKTSYKIVRGKKSLLNVKNTNNLKNCILNTTSPYLFTNKQDQKKFEKLTMKVKTTRLGGDCYSYCLLADGHVDIIVESGLNPWDIRALEPIIINAGGVLKTWDNKDIFDGGKIIATTNQKLLKKTIIALNE